MNTPVAAADQPGAPLPATDGVDRARPSSSRESRLLLALVGIVAAVTVFGLAFPDLVAPAIAIAVLAVIVAYDWLLPSGELRSMAERVEFQPGSGGNHNG